MVFVNSKKFACESCIKGHRSSSCSHSDRPLFEIKKKGRPVSQCDKCRELRKSRRVHSKCTCNTEVDMDSSQSRTSTSGTKQRRFVPIAPALPNGLKDVIQVSQGTHSKPPDARQRVDSLLNPCNCKSVWKCKCRTREGVLRAEFGSSGGLSTLAQAAAMCCSSETASSSSSSSPQPYFSPAPMTSIASIKHPISRPNSPNHKRSKPPPQPQPQPQPIPTPSLALPPIRDTYSFPTFPTMPPMSAMTSLAGSGCTCGLQCACPGCTEHRGPDHALKERKDCTEGCGHCIDNRNGIALPLPGHENLTNTSTGTNTIITNSILDQFFARAAALPAPPPSRKMGVGVHLDPTNVITMTYPYPGGGGGVGTVELPKLECCGGACGCPNGMCGCGKSCDGCCAEHGYGGESRSSHVHRGGVSKNASFVPSHAAAPTPIVSTPSPLVPGFAVRSCCAGNVSVDGE